MIGLDIATVGQYRPNDLIKRVLAYIVRANVQMHACERKKKHT